MKKENISNNNGNTTFGNIATSKAVFSRYKSAIAEIMRVSYQFQHECINTAKLRKYAFTFSQGLMSGETELGSAQYCILSRINGVGYEYLNTGILNDCAKIIAIDDEYGALADELLTFIKNEAVSRNVDIICCYNPFLQYSLERVILPHKKIAICRSSSLCTVNDADRHIHSERFTDAEKLKKHKQLMKFNSKVIKELIPNCHQNLI